VSPKEKSKSAAQIKSKTKAPVKEKGKVRVIYGIHSLEAAIAGKTVTEVRKALSQALNIDPAAIAIINGQAAAGNYILQEGQILEFVRLAGEKGA
jgi:hypothetical protein